MGQEETFRTSLDLYFLSKKKRKKKKKKSDMQLDTRMCIMYLISLVCIYNCIGLARNFVWLSHIVSIQKNLNELFDPSNMYTFQCPKTLLLKFIGEHDQIAEPYSNVSSAQSYFVIYCKPIPCVCVEHSLPLSVFIWAHTWCI